MSENSPLNEPEMVDFVEEKKVRQRIPISSHPELILDEPEESPRPRRVERPKVQRPPAREAMWPSTWTFVKTTGLTLMAAFMVATIFSYWTPDEGFLPEEFRAKMQVVRTTQQPLLQLPTALPTAVNMPKIGIIAGHSGPPQDPSFTIDPGAVCDDNNDGVPELTELEINSEVAQLVVQKLVQRGYEVDLLEEFDPRLDNYRADTLVSIHTNDCRDYGFGATGYNAAGPVYRSATDAINEILVGCLINQYGQVTGLVRHTGLTNDMTFYHTFSEVSVDTPIAIIEIAFMFADRAYVTNNRPLIADGIVAGILCFLEPESLLSPTPTNP